MKGNGFFNLDLKQEVNQWLCIAFIGVWCFAVVFYYFIRQAEAVGENWNGNNASASLSM